MHVNSRPTVTEFQPTAIELDGSGLEDISSFKLLAEYWHGLSTQAQLDLILSVLIRETKMEKTSIRIFPELSEKLVVDLHSLGFEVNFGDDFMFMVSWGEPTIRPNPKELDKLQELMKCLPSAPPRPANFSSRILNQLSSNK